MHEKPVKTKLHMNLKDDQLEKVMSEEPLKIMS
mgnify:FL=1